MKIRNPDRFPLSFSFVAKRLNPFRAGVTPERSHTGGKNGLAELGPPSKKPFSAHFGGPSSARPHRDGFFWRAALCRRRAHAGGLSRVALVALLLGLLGATRVAAQSGERSVSATLSAQPPRVYVHQPFLLLLTIRAENVTLGKQFNLQGLPTGDVLKWSPFQELPTRREANGATLIEIHEFRCQAEALRPGTVEAAPRMMFQEVTQERTWLGSTTFQSQRQLDVSPLNLLVVPLPEAQRPADFSGAVGQFAFTLTASPREASVGDLITLTLSLTGRGYLEGIACPSLASNAAFKTYAPQPVSGASAGELRFEQIVIPQSPAATVLPTARFSFFDPLAEQYRTIEATGGTLNVRTRDATQRMVPYRPEHDASTPPPVGPDVAKLRPFTDGNLLSASAHSRLLALPRLILLAGALLLAGAATSMGGAWRRRRKALPCRSLVIRGVCQILLAAASWPAANQLERRLSDRRPVWTIAQTVAARIAPSRSAEPTVELAEHTPVTVTETWEGWLRVADGPRRGWIPVEAARPADEAPSQSSALP